jgi:hypothetical protein
VAVESEIAIVVMAATLVAASAGYIVRRNVSPSILSPAIAAGLSLLTAL